MPRRRLLSLAQQALLMEIPTDQRQLVRHYTLGDQDKRFIRQHRGPCNRLGVALQLTYLRYPGCVMPALSKVETHLTTFVAEQLGYTAGDLDGYGHREMTRLRHLGRICDEYGYKNIGKTERKALAQWLLPIAMKSGHGLHLAGALVEEMRRRKIIIPAGAVIDRLGATVRTKAENITFDKLIEGLSKTKLDQLDHLLKVRDEARTTWLAWLLKAHGSASTKNFHLHLERLKYIRRLGLARDHGHRVHQNRLRALARLGRKTTAQNLTSFKDHRRWATLAAVVLDLEVRLIDELITMSDHLLGSVVRRARKRRQEKLDESSMALHDKMQILTSLGESLLRAKAQGESLELAIESVVPWEMLASLVDESRQLSQATAPSTLPYLEPSYGHVRKYAPALLESFTFDGVSAVQPLLDGLDVLRSINRSGHRKIPDHAPTTFISRRWAPLVLTGDGINRHFYEFAALSGLRDALRAGDIWVEGSGRYRSFEDYLLALEQVRPALEHEPGLLAVEVDCGTYLKGRLEELESRLLDVRAKLAGDGLEGVAIKDGKLRISPLPTEIPDEAQAAARRAYALLPRIKITDLLVQVDRWTGFSRHFTHLHTAQPSADREALFAAILGDAINLGPTKMAAASPDLTSKRLMWTSDWHVREETYSKAMAEVVNVHHRLAFSQHWGQGTTSSSDGQAFETGGHGRSRGRLNAKYGRQPIVMFYSHISDQYGPLYAKTINASDRDAPYVLDGLLYHETDLQLEEHYTDTAGFTDHIFAMCHLFGFRFAPRIRGLGDKRLCVPVAGFASGPLESLCGEPVHVISIRDNWEDVLRLAVSIRTGTVTASLILRKLSAQRRQSGLSRALREVGRVERTLFVLDWLEDPELRKRVRRGLNKGEAENSLKRAVFMHRLGQVRDRTFEAQQKRVSGLNLVVAAIVLWNTVHLAKVAQEAHLPHHVLKHISPLGWDHINLAGDYRWDDLETHADALDAETLASIPLDFFRSMS